MPDNEISKVIGEIGTLLLPLMPYLYKGGILAGKEAVKAIGKRVGISVWANIIEVWEKLEKKFKELPNSDKALKRISHNTDSLTSKNDFQKMLTIIFSNFEESDLIKVTELVHKLSRSRDVVISAGDRSIAIGGNVEKSSINIGDISRSKQND